jgi:hypothetical protein
MSRRNPVDQNVLQLEHADGVSLATTASPSSWIDPPCMRTTGSASLFLWTLIAVAPGSAWRWVSMIWSVPETWMQAPLLSKKHQMTKANNLARPLPNGLLTGGFR